MDLKLAVYDFCPYCQRVRIVLEHHGIQHDLIRLDPERLPDWFLEASPRGRAPLLLADGVPLVESAVIATLIDEMAGAKLMPAEPLGRAQARAWIEFTGGCQAKFGALIRATDADAFSLARQALDDEFNLLAPVIPKATAFFSGPEPSMVDFMLAPLFVRMLHLDPMLGCIPDHLPGFRPWAERVAALPQVVRSVDGDPRGVLAAMVEHLAPDGYVGSRWGSL